MQLEFFDVPSPCIGICQTDEKGYCLGCLRTRDERQIWKDCSNDDKQRVIKRCIQRKKRQAKRIENEKHPERLVEKLVEKPEDNPQPSLLTPINKIQKIQSDDLDFGDFEL